ncbi:MAG: TetR/AcrR family transcriptional regulator [Desulfofustis sp. PB-SRB1]|jgi:AcrR family transcriptional regulator|nr:TetR/AcrR family transcriptional regulator [Desulfofustis sp. PB-SRB1]MBM1002356.1 TetR/AcrR family transcriptional regulator [Desulfofustis sp. PB-SRB1]HBH30277.1 TetR/AcrR family transcriptional regulator [Desulfofustis sp.]HBH31267.1 TetR/AcrR family transcriptional regulator [Desulfofustis sp.]
MRKNSSYHHGDLKEALIQKALEHLNNGADISAVSLRGLAAELGVSKGAPYRHFPSADMFVAAVGQRGFVILTDQLTSTAISSKDKEPPEYALFHKRAAAYLQFAYDHPHLYRTMFLYRKDHIIHYPELIDAALNALQVLREDIDAIVNTKTKPSVTGEQAFLAAWAYLHGLADIIINRLTDLPAPPEPDFFQGMAAVITSGI